MKKVLAMIFAAMISILAVSCSDSQNTSGPTSAVSPASSNTANTTKAAESKTAAKDNGTLGDYAVAIESARSAKDYEGKPVVIVKYKFTNNGDKATSFIVAISGKVFQDGVELELATVTDTSYKAEDSMKEIKKGASIEVEEAYKLSNEKSKIEVEASELISLNDEKLTKEFDVTKLSK